MDAVTVSTLLTEVGTIFTSAIGWVGQVGQTIVENPLTLMYAVLPLCGIGVGFFKRLISVN